MLGPVYLFLAADVRRYLPLVWFIARLQILFGVGMLVLDVVVGMPLPWIVSEGPGDCGLVPGGLVVGPPASIRPG
jgi:hypothetical protein